ncbi:MAG: N-acetyl-gamma-glutamyl-phosphate reductase [Actinobacteria bacterium]|jgi:N-acetyl-gamma-glutamyl-phosphate reductase|nr:N-acetyl-gamma-glutamyl-phosphate reductase [Actinomycetota bacterium]NBP54016.1 N-acetyl-gamma-glutamyl-phosphate reductase [Actinomycetota bacterium]
MANKRAAILGATGYTGVELLRLLAGHPHLEVVYATGDSQAGQRIATLYPSLAAAYPTLVAEEHDASRLAGLDVVFLCTPHESSLELVPELIGRVEVVVDLSAAFRLTDASQYPAWYGFTHTHPELLARAVYGLPEVYRTELAGARLIATPGCYVTAATLALRPLVAAGMIEQKGIIVDAASGVSGAGKALKSSSMFCGVDEDFTAYGLVSHRHTPEMQQLIGGEILFTPHLAPMNRGILATCYARPSSGVTTTDDVMGVLQSAYSNEPFVVVSDSIPSTKATLGTNAVHITARVDPRTGHAIVISALDNLTKGASGGAVQAANVALGLPETSGLSSVGVWP